MPIEYIVDPSTSVSDEAFAKLLEVHLKAGFDILERPSEVQARRQPIMSFWQTMIINNRITTKILTLIKESMQIKLGVGDLALASKHLQSKTSISDGD